MEISRAFKNKVIKCGLIMEHKILNNNEESESFLNNK